MEKRIKLPRKVLALISLLFTIIVFGLLLTIGLVKIYNELPIFKDNVTDYVNSTSSQINEYFTKLESYYNKLPTEPTVSVCLILDPMLATGGSAVATVDVLKRWGAKKIKFVGIIGAPEGVRKLQQVHPDVPIHLAALDDHLNEHGYIVPGLGDAGDRQFGTG